MTTETESIEALHLWLATELPELRFTVTKFGDWGDRVPPSMKDHVKRGWAPNVTTDELLEALRARKWHVVFTHDGYVGFSQNGPWGDPDAAPMGFDGSFVSCESGAPNEALCRAARKALEAAS